MSCGWYQNVCWEDWHGDVEWIQLAQDRGWCRVVNSVMNLGLWRPGVR
jgi:hypothetical protein